MTADETRVFAHEDGGREALAAVIARAHGKAWTVEGARFHVDHRDRHVADAILGSSWLSGHVAAAVAADRADVVRELERAAVDADCDMIQVGEAFVRRNPYASETFRAAAQMIARSGS